MCFIGYPYTFNSVKNIPLRVVFWTLFSVFGYPDETLSLLLDIVKNPNWYETDQLAIYKTWPSRIWTRDYRETNPAIGRVEALYPAPPDYNTSALNLSATLPYNETWTISQE